MKASEARLMLLTPVLALLVAACAGTTGGAAYPQFPASSQLSGDEIEALVAGNTLAGKLFSGRNFQAYYEPDGKWRFRHAKRGDDTGSWWVEGDLLCSTLDNMRPEERCSATYRTGDGRYTSVHSDTGRYYRSFSVEPGNTHNLPASP